MQWRGSVGAGRWSIWVLLTIGAGCGGPLWGDIQSLEKREPTSPGSWSKVGSPFPAGGGPATVALLTDGRVLASGPSASPSWWALSPDSHGSYENGSWSAPLARSPVGRWCNPSYILRDGRFWIGGGEVMSGSPNGAENEIYDPVANSWTVAPEMPQIISDTPSAMLGDGRILVLGHADVRTCPKSGCGSYLFTSFGQPPSWASAAPWSPAIGDQESGSLLLQDGSVLMGSRTFERYLPWSNVWMPTASLPGGAGVFLSHGSDEMGALLLLHDGRALALGSSSHNGLYTPPVDATGLGSWTMTADTPLPYNHGDTPAVVEPDGKILTVVTGVASGLGDGVAVFYEYDPEADRWTENGPPSDESFSAPSGQHTLFLVLPNGQIWTSTQESSSAWLYTPAGKPRDQWRPIIAGVTGPRFGSFTLSGSQLNGLTTGADFGDDNKMATNFPIVSLSDQAGHTWYGASMGFDQMTPSPGHAGSFSFTVPSSLPDGSYALHVAANGVLDGGLPPMTLTFSGPSTSSLTGPDDPLGTPNDDPVVETVTLAAPAPPGGTVVELSSSNPAVAAVDQYVTVPAGASSANVNVWPRAGIGTTILKASTVANARFVATKTFGWSVASVSGPPTTSSDGKATWAVSLDKAAPSGGAVLSLQSTNTALVTVPGSVTVPAGKTSATFPVSVVDPMAGHARITASLVGSSHSAPFGWGLTLLTGPATAADGIGAIWSVSLNGEVGSAGMVVSLTSSNPAAASVPATATVPPGQRGVSFPVKVVTPAAGPTPITASLNNSSLMSAFGSW
jgi:hypothetical protein